MLITDDEADGKASEISRRQYCGKAKPKMDERMDGRKPKSRAEWN